MSNKAVIIGAGNIGRGFVGQLMFEGGFDTVFIDVSAPLVDALNTSGEYPLDIVSNRGSRRHIIKNVSAVNGNSPADAGGVSDAMRAVADCDICVTSVGAKALKNIIPNLAGGIKLRLGEGGSGKPLNLLICENLMHADDYIRSLLKPELTPDELSMVGLVETSVGRMVPLPDPETAKSDPLLVRAEAYGVLPCDADAFVGDIPKIKNIHPVSPFDFVIQTKLYIHNMGHAICAYLGMRSGYTYISDAIADPEIRIIVREAMTESAVALAKRFNKPFDELIEHTNDLIRRFGNRALRDTCARVGADIPRKLAASDRLTGAASSVLEAGGKPVFIAVGAAAALDRYMRDSAGAIFRRAEYDPIAIAPTVLASLAGEAAADSPYGQYVLSFLPVLHKYSGMTHLILAADEMGENGGNGRNGRNGRNVALSGT
ncbi:MAG: mannitol dehydrogenase [Clostridiales bacterium]|nr:mannitol dehydrogenase [Clostridiales bacterium]